MAKNATLNNINGSTGHIAKREAFKGNSMSAEIAPIFISRGQLVPSYYEYLMKNIDRVVYVVYSYETPIAWISATDDGYEVIVPDIRYSVTTTHHQNICRVWLK